MATYNYTPDQYYQAYQRPPDPAQRVTGVPNGQVWVVSHGETFTGAASQDTADWTFTLPDGYAYRLKWSNLTVASSDKTELNNSSPLCEQLQWRPFGFPNDNNVQVRTQCSLGRLETPPSQYTDSPDQWLLTYESRFPSGLLVLPRGDTGTGVQLVWQSDGASSGITWAFYHTYVFEQFNLDQALHWRANLS